MTMNDDDKMIKTEETSDEDVDDRNSEPAAGRREQQESMSRLKTVTSIR